MKKCIICEQRDADSSEHKILKCLYKYFNPNNDKMYFVDFINNDKEIKGPKAEIIQYSKVLCFKCNGALTQKSDNEFEQLIKSIHNGLNKDNSVKLTLYEDNQLMLYKYLSKILACRINFVDYRVPKSIRDFILNDNICLDDLEGTFYLSISGSNKNYFYHLGRSGYIIEDGYWFLEEYCIGKIRFDFAFKVSHTENELLYKK